MQIFFHNFLIFFEKSRFQRQKCVILPSIAGLHYQKHKNFQVEFAIKIMRYILNRQGFFGLSPVYIKVKSSFYGTQYP